METEKTVEEIFVVASKVDGTDSTRLDRLNCLKALKVRLSSWLSVLHARKEGPSLMEMDLIVKDIEDRLESIKKDSRARSGPLAASPQGARLPLARRCRTKGNSS